jgi:hypothetical protein
MANNIFDAGGQHFAGEPAALLMNSNMPLQCSNTSTVGSIGRCKTLVLHWQ